MEKFRGPEKIPKQKFVQQLPQAKEVVKNTPIDFTTIVLYNLNLNYEIVKNNYLTQIL